jgi:hypothetical protein
MKRGTLLVVLVALCILGNAACGGNGHHTVTIPSANFTFYAFGEDAASPVSCVAGVVAIATTASADGSFAVVNGVQDYNDADITSPQPGGDTIMGGSLVLASDGTGTLTLITNNPDVGVDDTETFALVFPNPAHALIIQFDGINTSSGSIDLQTSTAIPSGSFAFTAAGGADTGDGIGPTAFGGVFTVTAGAVTGLVDSNVIGGVTLGTAIPDGVTLSTPDTTFGRGSVIGNTGIATNLNYYVVGPEVIRIIDVDSATIDTVVGSAYGQGANPSFSSASIGSSVFSFSNAFQGYAAAGQFFTSADDGAKPKAGKPVPEGVVACTGTSTCLFSGVGDLNELLVADPVQLVAADIDGSYSVAASGYGNLTIGADFGDTDDFGVYAVDPHLNILDPNDTADTTGGALLAEMDDSLVGTGSIVPQTDITVDHFSGTYAGGGSGNTTEGDEFDFLALATVTESNGTFSATATVSDPFGALTGADQATADATINAPIVPDIHNPGRYDLSPLVFATTNTPPPPVFSTNMAVGAYQASGSQLFWIETDSDSYFGGSLELFPGTGNDDAKKAKLNNTKWKH